VREPVRSCEPADMFEVRRPPLVGIFVGGASRRMGGQPKGLLAAPDGSGSLVERLVSLARARGLAVVLVGDHPAYRDLGLETLKDAAVGAGPLGGLVSLLEHGGGGSAIALACDLPFIDGPFLARLAHESPDSMVLAPRRAHGWEPLAARYDVQRVLPIARARLAARALGLQGLCDAAGARELTIDPLEADKLADWDSPEDVSAHATNDL